MVSKEGEVADRTRSIRGSCVVLLVVEACAACVEKRAAPNQRSETVHRMAKER
jgi:hypothetical protein